MEFILTDANGIDVGILPESATISLDCGEYNDYELSADLADRELIIAGGFVYCEGTEYGGIITNPESDTAEGSYSAEGPTFRGMLDQRFVLVPDGSDYRSVSGDVNAICKELLEEQYDSLFFSEDGTTGINFDGTIPRYYSLLDSLQFIADATGCRVKLTADGSGTSLKVWVSIENAPDLSEIVEYSQDSGCNFRIQQVTRKYEYALALGGGSLKDRTVKMLHITESGYEEVTSFPMNVPVYKYDYSAAEDEDDLIESCLDAVKEANGEDSQEMTVPEDDNLQIGTIVAGRDYVTGMYIKQQVTGMKIRVANGKRTIEYTIGG